MLIHGAFEQASECVKQMEIRCRCHSFQNKACPDSSAGRAEFVVILDSHLADRGFCSDMIQLLRGGAKYDPHEAGEYVKTKLLSLLPK